MESVDAGASNEEVAQASGDAASRRSARARLRARRILAAALLVALAAGSLWWRMQRPVSDAATGGYQTVVVARGAVAARVTATGTLSPRVEVQVGSQVSGRIQELLVDFNSPVREGQVIARIDPRLFEAELAKARANRLAARAQVARTEADLADATQKRQRASVMAASGIGSQAEADTTLATQQAAEAALAAARASLAQTEAAVGQAETNLGYTTIVSPIDGVVISRQVDVGQTVAASLQTPTLFTIAGDLRKMEVHTHVAEADVGRLEPGMAAEFVVDAHPLERFRGTVREVRYAPETVQNVVTYDAVISVENPDLLLRPGMTADVSFVVAERDDALLVPNAALRFQPPAEVITAVGRPPATDAAHRVVWVRDDRGSLRGAVLRIGISDGRSTEVLEGLSVGDVVVVGTLEEQEEGASNRPRFGRYL